MVQQTTMSFPMTRQGVRNLDEVGRDVLPISGGQPRSRTNMNTNEKLLSTLAGGALAIFGLHHGGLGGLLSAAAGSAFLYRGLTGHCSLYQALGINHAGHDPTKELAYRAQ
jgi:uncharacterized membrane protein